MVDRLWVALLCGALVEAGVLLAARDETRTPPVRGLLVRGGRDRFVHGDSPVANAPRGLHRIVWPRVHRCAGAGIVIFRDSGYSACIANRCHSLTSRVAHSEHPQPYKF